MSGQIEPKYVTTMDVALPVYSEGGTGPIEAPPEQALRVCVVAERAFLDLCNYSEEGRSFTFRVLGSATVNAEALLNALVSQMPVERVAAIFQVHQQ